MGVPTLLKEGSLQGHPDEVPIEYITRWLRERMPAYGAPPPTHARDRVLVVKSQTGSGKSTVLPVHIFYLLRSPHARTRTPYSGRSVLCTQPRVLTAVSLGQDIAAAPHYPTMLLGLTVGYQTGVFVEKPPSGLVYATAGVLLVQLQMATADPKGPQGDEWLMARYAFIVIDEAHERSLDTDTVLALLKRFISRNLGNPNLPFVILASATIDTLKYATYFGVAVPPGQPETNVMSIVGRQYPIEITWPAVGTNDFVSAAIAKTLELHRRGGFGDILIFMSRIAEIKKVVLALQAHNVKIEEAGGQGILPLGISRDVINSRQREYFWAVGPAKALPLSNGVTPRRVIVSNVVAETGITFDSLKYVIDSGWSMNSEVYFPHGAHGIIARPAAKSRIAQRKGRAGRLFPGEFHPLYTESVYNALPDQQLPDIVSEGMDPIFLNVVNMNGGTLDLDNLDLLDPPPVDAVARSINNAVLLGFLHPRTQSLTRLGRLALLFPRMSMPEIRMVLAGYVWDASLHHLISCVALLRELRSLEDLVCREVAIAYRKSGDDLSSLLREITEDLGVQNHRDDVLTALGVYQKFADAVELDFTKAEEWCELHQLNYGLLVSVTFVREGILTGMLTAGFNPFLHANQALDAARLKRCLYDGYRHQLFTKTNNAYSLGPHPIKKIQPMLDSENAERVIATSINVVPAPNALLRWELRPGLVCVMDDYVAPDTWDTPDSGAPLPTPRGEFGPWAY